MLVAVGPAGLGGLAAEMEAGLFRDRPSAGAGFRAAMGRRAWDFDGAGRSLGMGRGLAHPAAWRARSAAAWVCRVWGMGWLGCIRRAARGRGSAAWAGHRPRSRA